MNKFNSGKEVEHELDPTPAPYTPVPGILRERGMVDFSGEKKVVNPVLMDYMGYCRRPHQDDPDKFCCYPLPCMYHEVVQWTVNKMKEDEGKREAFLRATNTD